MFNTKFLGKRKYAVYKQDGTPWTQKEYKTVVNLFEGHDSDQECFDDYIPLLRKYIADKINENRPMYHVWSFAERELTGLTKISYEDLLKQSKIPLLKRRKDDSHKNETPTTSSK